MSRIQFICLTVLATFAQVTETVGPVVRCGACNVGELTQCKPLPTDCAEKVREPGCGCCMTCALSEGRSCGVYTRRCGADLTCQLKPGETKPLQALLEGRGVCSTATSRNLGGWSSPLREQEKDRHMQAELESNGHVVINGTETQALKNPLRSAGPRTPLQRSKEELIQREQYKKSQSYKTEPLPGEVSSDAHNFSFQPEREVEYGPCRREMEDVMKSLIISRVLNPKGVRIPNCDKKGFYKKKQCRSSRGRNRGLCWCVDRYGQPLPGLSGKERGAAQCHSLDNK